MRLQAVRSVHVAYSRVSNVTKKSAKMSSAKGFVLDLTPIADGGSAEQLTLANFSVDVAQSTSVKILTVITTTRAPTTRALG